MRAVPSQDPSRAPGIRLRELLTRLKRQGGASAEHLATARQIDRRRGVLYGIGGAVLLLAVTFAPLPTEGRQATNVLRLFQQLNLLAFFLIVRARRYFQVSADSLLAVDKRPPILFLRSFADDERQRYSSSERALLDFSLETRLANHFLHFGPFVAVGSPKETVPQPGAARVLLADEEWQSRVLGWMKDSNLIIMYCGASQWVNWELEKVVESGRSTSLILRVSRDKGFPASRRQKDITARVEQIRDVFRDTPWHEELMEFSDFTRARAMLFRADGSVVIIKSRSRSRDSYHLGALIAHQQLLEPMTVPDGAVVRLDVPAWVANKGRLGDSCHRRRGGLWSRLRAQPESPCSTHPQERGALLRRPCDSSRGDGRRRLSCPAAYLLGGKRGDGATEPRKGALPTAVRRQSGLRRQPDRRTPVCGDGQRNRPRRAGRQTGRSDIYRQPPQADQNFPRAGDPVVQKGRATTPPLRSR